jgi:hypothetical protein
MNIRAAWAATAMLRTIIAIVVTVAVAETLFERFQRTDFYSQYFSLLAFQVLCILLTSLLGIVLYFGAVSI